MDYKTAIRQYKPKEQHCTEWTLLALDRIQPIGPRRMKQELLLKL
jgi:hypothetical protein